MEIHKLESRGIVDIDEAKERIIDITTDIGAALPYEADQLEGQTWDELASELQVLSVALAHGTARISGWAGLTRRWSL